MKIAIVLVILLVIIIGALIFLASQSFGTSPGPEYTERFSRSPQYDKEKKIFINRRPALVEEMRKRAMTFAVFKEWFSKGIDRSPSKPLPQIIPDMAEFLKPSEYLKSIWFGHSTFILNMEGKIILVDPVFGHAGPLNFSVKRFQDAVLKITALPEIDYIVISHDHYDHLDKESIEHFKDKKTKFLTPLGVSSHLKGWGIAADRITELDWWEEVKIDGLEFICTPAQHFSGRNGITGNNETLWASWVLRSPRHNIFFSGDTGYDTHFKAIGDKYGPFEIAFMESGQYNEKWREVHMLPDEAVTAYQELRAYRYFPIHWGMFVLAFHSWYDPIVRLQQAAIDKKVNLISPRLGQIVYVNDDYQNEYWWDESSSSQARK